MDDNRHFVGPVEGIAIWRGHVRRVRRVGLLKTHLKAPTGLQASRQCVEQGYPGFSQINTVSRALAKFGAIEVHIGDFDLPGGMRVLRITSFSRDPR